MAHKSILHVSDLHRNQRDEDDQKVVLEAFVADLRRQKDNGIDFDLLLFTGDIVRSADLADDYVTAAEDMLKIAEAAVIPESAIVYCPGNHDTGQKWVNERIETLTEFRKSARNRDDFNRLTTTEKFREYVAGAFEAYNSFLNLYDNSMRVFASPFGEVRLFPSLDVGVVSMNTAILSGAGLKGAPDRNALGIPEHALRECLGHVPTSYGTIVIGHHPLDWFNDDARGAVEGLLASSSAHYFHGHMHDVNPRYIRGLSGSSCFFQASALFCGRANNGYAICALDESCTHSWLRIRSYYDRRNQFDVATDRAPCGEFFSSDEAKAVFGRDEANVTLRTWQMTTLRDYYRQYSSDTLAVESLSDVFVDPEFERDAPLKKDVPIKLGRETVRVEFKELFDADTNLIISAAAESGRTSLLLEWAMREAGRGPTEHRLRIPIYFPFDDVPAYPARYVPVLRGRLPQLPSGIRLEHLLEKGEALFLIDDVDLQDAARMLRLKRFLDRYPNCRYVVTTGTSLLSTPGVQPMIGETVKFEAVRLRPLRIGQLRLLAERLGVRDRAENEKLISRLYDEMKALAVPITPVTSTFLLRIYKDDDAVTFVNRATLIERFIELLLDRYAFQELVPGSFDFVNKTHLLSFIAEKIVHLENYTPNVEVIRSWISEYLLDLGLAYSPDKVLEYFVSARVLRSVDDKVAFKLKAFFSYFAALRMSNDANFKEYILAPDRFLGFCEEIGFYSAIARDDQDTLSALRSRYEAVHEEALLHGDAKAQVSRLRNFKLPDEKEPDAFLRSIEEQIFSEPLSPTERDAILYSETPAGDLDQTILCNMPGDSERPIAQLSLLSTVIRHMDLIPDQAKRETLRALIDGWNALLVKSLTIVPALMSKQRMTLEGVDYRLTLPEGVKTEQFTRDILLAIPIAIARMAFYRLGSEKLVPQLLEGVGSSSEEVEAQMMRFCILADIGVRNLHRIAETLEKAIRPYRYLTNVLLTKLNETLLRLQYDEAEAAQLRNTAANILIGRGGTEASDAKGSFITKMKRREVALRVRVEQSDKADHRP